MTILVDIFWISGKSLKKKTTIPSLKVIRHSSVLSEKVLILSFYRMIKSSIENINWQSV